MKTAIWVALAAVLFGAVGFWGGVTYQKSQGAAGFSARGANGGAGFNRQGPNGARMTAANVATGTVIAQDAQSITIKTADGGSKTVFVSVQTEISKQTTLTAADLKVGDQVAAFGQAANGGIDARTVQVVPPGGSFRFGGLGGAGGRGVPGGPSGSGAMPGQ